MNLQRTRIIDRECAVAAVGDTAAEFQGSGRHDVVVERGFGGAIQKNAALERGLGDTVAVVNQLRFENRVGGGHIDDGVAFQGQGAIQRAADELELAAARGDIAGVVYTATLGVAGAGIHDDVFHHRQLGIGRAECSALDMQGIQPLDGGRHGAVFHIQHQCAVAGYRATQGSGILHDEGALLDIRVAGDAQSGIDADRATAHDDHFTRSDHAAGCFQRVIACGVEHNSAIGRITGDVYLPAVGVVIEHGNDRSVHLRSLAAEPGG